MSKKEKLKAIQEMIDENEKPRIDIDTDAIRFHDATGSNNYFFEDMVLDKEWSAKVLRNIFQHYGKCILYEERKMVKLTKEGE